MVKKATYGMVVTFVSLLGIVGLGLFARSIWNGNVVEEADPTIREELVALVATPSMVEFAKSLEPGGAETAEELADKLEAAGLGDQWLVMVVRARRASGRFQDLPSFTRPGRLSTRFGYDRLFMRILAGKPPSDFDGSPRLMVVPEETAEQIQGLKPEEAWERLKDHDKTYTFH